MSLRISSPSSLPPRFGRALEIVRAQDVCTLPGSSDDDSIALFGRHVDAVAELGEAGFDFVSVYEDRSRRARQIARRTRRRGLGGGARRAERQGDLSSLELTSVPCVRDPVPGDVADPSPFETRRSEISAYRPNGREQPENEPQIFLVLC